MIAASCYRVVLLLYATLTRGSRTTWPDTCRMRWTISTRTCRWHPPPPLNVDPDADGTAALGNNTSLLDEMDWSLSQGTCAALSDRDSGLDPDTIDPHGRLRCREPVSGGLSVSLVVVGGAAPHHHRKTRADDHLDDAGHVQRRGL